MAKIIIDYKEDTTYESNLPTHLTSYAANDPDENGIPTIKVSEYFTDAFQGEGINVGVPCAFLRLSGCHLGCTWCDSTDIWKKSKKFTIPQMLMLMDECGDIEKMKTGDFNLVITGGAPLLQMDMIVKLIEGINDKYGFVPTIEIETEGTITPSLELMKYVSLWNVSPKLETSGVKESVRYKKDTLLALSYVPNLYNIDEDAAVSILVKTLENGADTPLVLNDEVRQSLVECIQDVAATVTYKFVITDVEKDWDEIQTKFIDTNIIPYRQMIILMPNGINKEQLDLNRQKVAELAVSKQVRFSDRLQITIYDDKKSV